MYKLAITLIWLSLPVAASLMLRADYQHYLDDSRTQQQDCLNRVAYLRTYSVVVAREAAMIVAIDSVAEKYSWERNWLNIQRRMHQEAAPLRPELPAYYTQTDTALLPLEADLAEMQDLAKEALWSQDAYFKSADGLGELREQINNAKMTASYYKRIGAEGIYLMVQEDLAEMESAYNRRLRERARLANDVDDKISLIDRKSRDILRETSHISSTLAKDESENYRSILAERVAAFNLREELTKLLGSPAQASSD